MILDFMVQNLFKFPKNIEGKKSHLCDGYGMDILCCGWYHVVKSSRCRNFLFWQKRFFFFHFIFSLFHLFPVCTNVLYFTLICLSNQFALSSKIFNLPVMNILHVLSESWWYVIRTLRAVQLLFFLFCSGRFLSCFSWRLIRKFGYR